MLSSLPLSMHEIYLLSRTNRCCSFWMNYRGPSRTLWNRLQLRWMHCRTIFSKSSKKFRLRSDWTSNWVQLSVGMSSGFSDLSPMIMNLGTWVYQLQNFMSFQASMTWPEKELFWLFFLFYVCKRIYVFVRIACASVFILVRCYLLCPIVSTAM